MGSDDHRVAKLTESVQEMGQLIGLDSVKAEFQELVDIAVDQQRRRELDPALPADPMTMHLVFTGNPGTGKTTVAQSLGKAYYGLGLLNKPDVTMAKKQDLVGAFVGQTEEKTQELWKKAQGGVLFIDEAYRLTGDPFGQTAMDQLMELMENDRANTVVIIAGYPKETRKLLSTNPGLRSRFPKSVRFPDYSDDELYQIAGTQFAAGEYELDDDATDAMVEAVTKLPKEGNARTVRNFTESVRRAQARRLRQVEKPSRKELQRITVDDVNTGLGMFQRATHDEEEDGDVADNDRHFVMAGH